MTFELIAEILVVGLCILLGGVLKGATGAGAPVLAIPALALMFDVRFAVVVMIMPNLLSNTYQLWKYRPHLPEAGFWVPLVVAAVIGVLFGTWLLVTLPLTVLPLFVAVSVFGYVALRLSRPDWVLSFDLARRLTVPAGLAAGILQGASGLSAPVSITFLNSIRLPRPVFIATISSMFTAFSAVQLAALWFGGVATGRELAISLAALAPITVGMWLGSLIARRLDPKLFDRAILILLTLIALRLLAGFIF